MSLEICGSSWEASWSTRSDLLKHSSTLSSTPLSQQSPSEGSGGEGKEQRTFLEKHIVDVHPQDIAVPLQDQDQHVELCHRPCLFATCGSGQPHFMAAYLYHAVAKGL